MDVLLLAESFTAGAARVLHPVPHVEEQGAGAAGEAEHALQALLGARLWFLVVQRNDAESTLESAAGTEHPGQLAIVCL